jgi:hypothetical protein
MLRTIVMTGFGAAAVTVVVLFGLGVMGFENGTPTEIAEGGESGWAQRTVWACDQRKAVIVEGVRPNEKMSPHKAQQVADLLTDLMRFCDQEVKARISTREVITLSVNGLPYQRYVPGDELPIQLVHGGSQHGRREQMIWKLELEKLVKEGDRLFHSDEIGSNGLACAMCHPNGSNTHPETYPKFQTQLKEVALLRHMVNWCIINPLEGDELDHDDPRMIALEAYMLAERAGTDLEVGKH